MVGWLVKLVDVVKGFNENGLCLSFFFGHSLIG